MTHALKTWPVFFKPIELGDKTFEVRRDDRDFKVGDDILLQEYDPTGKVYSGKEWRGFITIIYNNIDGVKKGFVVFGIRKREIE